MEAVLQDIADQEVDLILVGGDIATGPFPRETLERLMHLGDRVRYIRGNADREAAEGEPSPLSSNSGEPTLAAVIAWTAARLTPAQRRFLATLPETASIDIESLGRVLFCHGSPRSDTEMMTEATPEDRIGEMLHGVEEQIVVCGHTHMQFDRHIGSTRVLNAGSVGMPYEGKTGAFWLMLGPNVDFRRTTYDTEHAAELIRASGYPDAEDFAAHNVLAPPTREEAIAVFEGMEQ
jgi:predicted phosphodiesterase